MEVFKDIKQVSALPNLMDRTQEIRLLSRLDIRDTKMPSEFLYDVQGNLFCLTQARKIVICLNICNLGKRVSTPTLWPSETRLTPRQLDSPPPFSQPITPQIEPSPVSSGRQEYSTNAPYHVQIPGRATSGGYETHHKVFSNPNSIRETQIGTSSATVENGLKDCCDPAQFQAVTPATCSTNHGTLRHHRLELRNNTTFDNIRHSLPCLLKTSSMAADQRRCIQTKIQSKRTDQFESDRISPTA